MALVLGVLGLWLGASKHCLLENISALQFLVCAPHGERAPHQDKDCEEDLCASVEKAAYKSEQAQTQVPTPLLVLLPGLISDEPQCREKDFASATPPQARSTELPTSAGWFAFHTVAPPRAPSTVS